MPFVDGQFVTGEMLTTAFGAKLDARGDASANVATPTNTVASRTLASKLGDNPSVFDFVAASDNTSDYGPAVNRCLAAGYNCDIPTWLPLLTPITFKAPGQKLSGRGRLMSGFNIPASAQAAMAQAGGVLVANGLAIGPEIADLGLSFAQPASGTSWVQYPPAILLTSTPRGRIRNVRLTLGWIGLSAGGSVAAGGSGGLTVEDFESACLSLNVGMDQCFDSCRFLNPHLWPFGILTDAGGPLHPNATNLLAQFTGTAQGYQFGRVDDLKITDGLSYLNNAMLFQTGADGNNSFATITGHDFDTYGGLKITAGQIGVQGGVMTLGLANGLCVYASGSASMLNLDDVRVLISETGGGNAAVTATTGAEISMDGMRFEIADDTAAVHIDGATTYGSVRDCTFRNLSAAGQTYSNYVAAFSGGASPFFIGNRYIAPTAAASQDFVLLSADAAGLIANNDFGGTAMGVSQSFTKVTLGTNANVASRPA